MNGSGGLKSGGFREIDAKSIAPALMQ